MALLEDNAELQKMVNLVRMYMRDFPHLNRLIDGEESSPRMIAWAIVDAMDDFNTTPPLIGNVSVGSFPSVHLLVRGATITLLESVMMLHSRNHLSYSDGGISVSKWDKAPLIQGILQMMKSTYEEKKLRLKVAMNIRNAWGGGVSSEYSQISGWYGSF